MEVKITYLKLTRIRSKIHVAETLLLIVSLLVLITATPLNTKIQSKVSPVLKKKSRNRKYKNVP